MLVSVEKNFFWMFSLLTFFIWWFEEELSFTIPNRFKIDAIVSWLEAFLIHHCNLPQSLKDYFLPYFLCLFSQTVYCHLIMIIPTFPIWLLNIMNFLNIFLSVEQFPLNILLYTAKFDSLVTFLGLWWLCW